MTLNRTTPRPADMALAIAEDMLAAVAGKPDGGRVNLPVAEFRYIAETLGRMAQSAACATGAARGASSEGFHDWIPVATFKEERERRASLERELATLRGQQWVPDAKRY